MVAGPGFYTYQMTTSLPTARVAVIMRTFERPVLLARAIASVQNQTLTDWVLVIVNNGGDPRAVDAIVKIANAGITRSGQVTVMHLSHRVGMEAASNTGLAGCESDYFVIHDDDDTWHPEFLHVAVTELATQGSAAGVVTGITRVTETMRGDRVWPIREDLYYADQGSLSFAALIGGNTFSPIGAVFRRSVLAEVSNYDESLPVLGDWEFNIRVAEKHVLIHVPDVLARYHVRSDQSDQGTLNSITGSVDLHHSTRQVLIDRWLHVTMPNGLNKGQLAITAAGARQAGESVRSMENWRIRVEELEHVVRDLQLSIAGDIANQNIAHQIVHIIEQRRLWRRIARVLLSPAHGLRAIKRRIAA